MTAEQQKEMANRIKYRRKSLNYTQEQFSELIGITASSYVKIENSFQKPSLDTLITIAKHLHLSLDYIVYGTRYENFEELSDILLLKSLLDYLNKDKLVHASEVLSKLAKIKFD